MSAKPSRFLAVLELLVQHVDGLPLTVISKHLDLSRSLAHRLLQEMIQCGLVQQQGELKPYRLTMKLISLGLTHLSHMGITEIIQPILDKLADMTGELARMSLVEGERLIWVAMSQGAKGGLRYDVNSDPGEEVRLFCSSNGQAWLSCLPDEKALEIVCRQGWGEPGQYGPNAPDSIPAFLECLSLARSRGYASVHDTYEIGVSAMAAPVLNPESNVPIGSISIAGPSSRLTPAKMEEQAPILLSAAAELSAKSIAIHALSK